MWKSLVIALLLVVMVAAPAAAVDEWTEEDTVWAAAMTLGLVLDWGTTRDIALRPHEYFETNPLLGPHPTVHEVDRYFIAFIAMTLIVARILPKDWRKTWLIGWTMCEFYYTTHNFSIGLTLNF